MLISHPFTISRRRKKLEAKPRLMTKTLLSTVNAKRHCPMSLDSLSVFSFFSMYFLLLNLFFGFCFVCKLQFFTLTKCISILLVTKKRESCIHLPDCHLISKCNKISIYVYLCVFEHIYKYMYIIHCIEYFHREKVRRKAK